MELALINGNMVTVDESGPRAEAVLISGERIVKVGSTEEIRGELPEKATTVDLKGRTVVPGFIDSHTHFVSWGLGLSRLDLREAATVSEALDMTKKRVKGSEKGEVIIGEGWDQSKWEESRYPEREELDKVAPRNPVILRRVCGHLAVANSEALNLIPSYISGIDWETGTLLGDPALNLNRLFPPSSGEILEAVKLAMKEAHKLGVTSIHDIVTPQYLRAYQELQKRGELNLRVYACFYEEYLDSLLGVGLRTGFGDGLLKFGGLKVFADGSLGARSAALSSPYQNSDEVGVLTHSDQELKSVMERAAGAGVQVLVHAIGDRAIGQVLSGYEKIFAGSRRGVPTRNNLRHRIEHVELPTPQQLRNMRELGIIAAMQPNFLGEWGQAGGMYEELLGEDRWRRNNPLREVADLDIPIAFGSDSMPFSPLYGIHWAVNHPIEEQRLTAEEAIRFYTLGSAHASFEEELKGSIQEGKFADLVVLSQDVTKRREIDRVEVVMTVLGGAIVFERAERP